MSAESKYVTTTPWYRRNLPPSAVWPFPLLVIAFAGCLTVVSIAISMNRYTDFEMLYNSAVALRHGTNLYVHTDVGASDANLNPPLVAVFMLPLAWLSIQHAAIVVWVVIGASMLAVALLLRRALSWWWVVATMAVVLASPGGYLSVRFINLTWPLAVGMTWAWLQMRNGKSVRAGAALGVLASIKLFFLLFGPYLVWKRQWRALVAFSLAGLVALGIGAAVCGLGTYESWVDQLSSVQWQGHSINVSLAGALQRNLDAMARGGFKPVADLPGLVRPLWMVASFALLLAVVASFKREDVDREWASLLVACLLISPLGWSYYWPVAAGPVGAVLASKRSGVVDVVAIGLCLTPFLILPYGQPSAVLTLSLGTTYTWGGLLLFWRLVNARKSQPMPPSESPSHTALSTASPDPS